MDGRHQLAMCAVFRDERLYLREWIAFHLLAGVDRFLLYDDQSRDGGAEEVADLVAEGIVDIRAWDRPGPSQMSAYNHALDRARERIDWVAFLDLDEYLFPCQVVDLKESLADYGEAAAVLVYWRTFGANGHKSRPTYPTIEAYTRCTPQDPELELNRHFKSIVRADKTLCSAGNPHQFIHTGAQPVDERWNMVQVGESSPSWDVFQINHYRTRSEEECEAKCRRGRADNKSLSHRRIWPDFFRKHQAISNSETNTSALDFVARAMDRWDEGTVQHRMGLEQFSKTLARRARQRGEAVPTHEHKSSAQATGIE